MTDRFSDRVASVTVNRGGRAYEEALSANRKTEDE